MQPPASDMTSTALPRLSVVMKESILHESASNAVALLPSSFFASRCTYVAIATNPAQQGTCRTSDARPTSTGKALDMSDLLSMYSAKASSGSLESHPTEASVANVSPALHKPVLQLCLYSLRCPGQPLSSRPSSKLPAALAPDMMRIQTIDLTSDDVRFALPQHHSTAQGEREKGILRSASTPGHTNQALSPETVVVEQIAWVGIRFLAVKTRQRQLLLVPSGLTEHSGGASSEDDASDMDEGAVHSDSQSRRSVQKSFSRVADFSTATHVEHSQKRKVAASVLFVAGIKHVSAIVVGGETATHDTKKAPTLVEEHTWSIGPFNHISAAATAVSSAADGPTFCLCGTSASSSVEVLRWTLHSSAPPVCVHHVLLSPDHFFYCVSVTAPSPSKSSGSCIDFWVVGGTTSDGNDNNSFNPGDSNERLPESPTLSALRGPDGNYFQVEAPTTTAQEKLNEVTAEALFSTAHSTLNSVWQNSSAHHKKTMGGGEQHAASISSLSTDVAPNVDTTTIPEHFSQLQSVASLRISAPPFFQSHSSEGHSNGAKGTSAHLKRYLLHIHASTPETCTAGNIGTEKTPTTTCRYCWSSELLSLDTADCAAALDWLASNDSNSELDVASWKLEPFAVVLPAETENVSKNSGGGTASSLQHELTLHSLQRVLKLCVKTRPHSLSVPQTRTRSLEIRVGGMHELPPSEYAVGLCAVPQAEQTVPLLLFRGTGQIFDDANGNERKEATAYGQAKVKTTWITIRDIRASLLLSLKPWRTTNGEEKKGAMAVDKEALLADLRVLVDAEGKRLQHHFDVRMDRLEMLLRELTQRKVQ